MVVVAESRSNYVLGVVLGCFCSAVHQENEHACREENLCLGFRHGDEWSKYWKPCASQTKLHVIDDCYAR